jgi:hypothetical protein
MNKRASIFLAMLATGVFIAQSMGGSANAADDLPNPIASHCVEFVNEEGDTTPRAPEVCYGSFQEALEDVFPNADIPDDIAPANLTKGMVETWAATAGQTVISIDYWNKNYNAQPNHSKTWAVRQNDGCRNGLRYQVDYVGDFHNEKFSSSKNYAGCDIVNHFENMDFGGAVLDCSPCGLMGTMNNKTSSIKWRKN